MSDSINALSDISLPFLEFPNLNSEFEVVLGIGDLDHPVGNLNDIANLDISIGSIPLLEQTPWILDDLTPNLSQDMIVDESGAEGMISIQGLLHEAGYLWR